jgi:lipid-A-disaccharide synthase
MNPPVAQLPFRLPPPADGCVDLLVIAGEHSGDEHAALAVRELRAKNPALRVCALGGPQLAAAGAQVLHDLTASSVVGFVEVLKHYSFFKALFEETLRWIGQHRPRAVCFVDYPGFNLRLAAALRERGLSVKGGGPVSLLHYISPQIWAWKRQRRFTMARDLDALGVIFPFEVECYADTDLPVDFVGHPFLASGYSAPVKHDPAGPVLLLPGSRKQAVARIFPVLLAAYQNYRDGGGTRGAVVIYPSEEIRAVLLAAHPPADVHLLAGAEGAEISPGARSNHPVAAAAVLTSSGTMSLHCALAGIPGAIAYRTNPFTYLLARWWVKLDYIGIANLLLNQPMYAEYIQGAARPEALATELRASLDDPGRGERTRAQAQRLHTLLDQPAHFNVADWLARELG